MLDEFIDVLLSEVDSEKDLFHDLCVHERGIESIAILLCTNITTTHDAHRNGILFTLLSDLFEGPTDRIDFAEDTFDLRPGFSPFFVIPLVGTQDKYRIHLRQVVYTRHYLLTKSSRYDHARLFVDDIFQELKTFLIIGECVDGIDSATKMSDGILAVTVSFIDVDI